VTLERVLDQVVVRAEQTGVWRLEVEEVPVIQEILCVYDRQICDASTCAFLEAKARLENTLRKEHTVSPIAKRLR
jgi:hypothetical protein